MTAPGAESQEQVQVPKAWVHPLPLSQFLSGERGGVDQKWISQDANCGVLVPECRLILWHHGTCACSFISLGLWGRKVATSGALGQ